MEEKCNRIYEDGGAYTARLINGVACCTSCEQPLKEHRNANVDSNNDSVISAEPNVSAAPTKARLDELQLTPRATKDTYINQYVEQRIAELSDILPPSFEPPNHPDDEVEVSEEQFFKSLEPKPLTPIQEELTKIGHPTHGRGTGMRITSGRAEFEAAVRDIMAKHQLMSPYELTVNQKQALDAVMSAWDISVRRVVGENDDDRPEITVWQIHSKEATRARNNLRHEQLRVAGLEGE